MGPSALSKCMAELIGTFALTFIGAGAILVSTLPGVTQPLLAIAIAHGLAIAVLVSATGHISGGHLNPAVTSAALATRKMPPALGIGYIIAQCVGSTLAAFILSNLISKGYWDPVHLGTPALGHHFSPKAGLVMEAVLTFLLVFVVFGTGMDSRGPKIGGLAIGGAVCMDILLGGPLTGASMNPARSFGPALISNFWEAHWIYWVGPIAGGVVAGLVYDKFVGKVP